MAEGIEVRHASGCRTLAGGRCSCSPRYRASVWSTRERKLLRRTFASLAEAKTWRADANAALRTGHLRVTPAPSLRVVIEQWLAGATAGTIRTRGRNPFTSGTIRAVRQHYSRRLEERFGSTSIDAITLLELQEYVDELEMQGLGPSTIEGTVLPLRLAYRWAKTKGIVAQDPTDGLELPQKARGTRVPPSPADAAALLEAAPEEDRTIWATAMLAGLRRGELLGLEWDAVDLTAGTLHVRRSWNPESSSMEAPKSRQGVRKVPIGASLATHLRRHEALTARREGLVFGDTASRPPRPGTIQSRADTAWQSVGLTRVTLHACRHLYASMSIAAGVNAHALCKYMGHSGIQVTYDLYGHLFPGNEAEAAALLDAYLDQRFRPSRG